MSAHNEKRLRKPDWLKIKLPDAFEYAALKKKLRKNNLHTICESGSCPNIGACWKAGTATFMILGDICTRSCKFCNVKTGKPAAPDLDEPQRIANAIKEMKLRHCVLTSVDRDDLPDGGANLWAESIKAIKMSGENITLECLIPDFKGELNCVAKIIAEKPEVISHNLETVKRLTPEVRGFAKYQRSLDVIKYVAKSRIISKSGIMVGLGETKEEVKETMGDLLDVGCSIMTIGQYLQPSPHNLPVHRYVHPDEFAEYKEYGLKKGFKHVESGPLVRSSYHAEWHI